MSNRRRRQKAIQNLIDPNDLNKIKNVLNYLFFDQYQDMASFPRFEECFTILTQGQEINFPEAFTDIIGEKHKYLTFRRMIRAFFRVQEGGRKVKESTKKFFDIIFNKTLKNDGEFIGEKLEDAIKFHSKSSENHKAISSFAIITDEKKEKIKGFQIYYDDFFKNDLFVNDDEKKYISLEVNLRIDEDRPEELKDKFPDKNHRDGIITILGTFTDHITFLGFKCRSGKTLFVGKPNGDPFLFSEVGKELKYVKIEIKDNFITYFEPHFEIIERANPHINKTSEEITDDFLKDDKPIFEEEKLQNLSEKELLQNVLQPLVPDDAFFNKNNQDVITGNSINEICPLTKRYWDKEPENEESQKQIDESTILNEADDFEKNQNSLKKQMENQGGIRDTDKKKNNETDQKKFNGNVEKETTPSSILLDPDNFDTLLTTLGDKISQDFKSGAWEKEKKEDEENGNVLKAGGRRNNGGFGFGFFDFGNIEDHFNEVRRNIFGIFDDDYYYDEMYEQEMKRRQQLEEERRRQINEQIIKQKTQLAQKNWQGISSKIAKTQGIYIIETIGTVIKGLKLLEMENAGIPNKYSIKEKVALFEVLRNNRPIIVMLSKAHQEALRRKKEEEYLNNDQQELERLKKEEEERKIEEKKKLEEDRRRQEEEQRIIEERKRIEEEQRRREVEERKRQMEIQAEKDRQRKIELERQEAEKKREEERKRLEEENKKKELERQQKLIEEQRRKAEEEQRRKEEQKQKEEEARKKKEEEERRKKEEEKRQQENARKQTKELKISDLPEINKKLELIQKMLPSATGEKAQMLMDYYQELMRDKNAIVEALNNEQKDKVAQNLGFDPEEAKRKEEEERKRLKEEEDKKILEKQKEEEAKKQSMTQVVSIQNVDIPPNVKTYRRQKMCPAGSIFTDDLFQPVKKSLCPVDAYGRWNYPKDITAEDLEGWEKIKWARAEKIFNSKNYQVFYQGVEGDDIIQGGLGDCYFLSAIAALCKYPKLIDRLFYIKEKSNEHCYGCYIRINGIWQLVLVDDYIPCYGNYGLNFVFTSTNGNELWVILLEKAWAKLNGNYAKAIGGEPHEVFDITTDAYSEKIVVKSDTSDDLWNKLMHAEKNNYIMTAGTSGDTYHLPIEQKGLVPGHAYTLLGVVEVNTSSGRERLVHLRNPWGNTEWSGDWSDKSKKWTSSIKEQIGGKSIKDDGSFYMSFYDFIQYYLVVGICHLHDDFVFSYLHCPKAKVNNGPIITRVEVINNSTHLYLQLHQKNPRIELKDGGYQDPVINYLFLVDKDNHYINASNNCYMNNCIEVNLNKGTYYLITDINFRYVQNKMHCYNLTTYSNYPVGIYEENNRNITHTFKAGLLDYARKNLQPQSHAGGTIYQSKRQGNEFPFNFIVFDNTSGQYDVTLKETVNCSYSRCADFYVEPGKEKASTVEKTVVANDYDTICLMPYNLSARFSYQLQSSARSASGATPVNNTDNIPPQSQQQNVKPSSNTNTNNNNNTNTQSQQEIAKAVFAEEAETLDNRGLLKQYVHQVPGGYYIGFENGSKQNLNMKLCLEGLYESNNPNLSDVPFTSNAMTRRLFLVKPKPGYRGGISFMFDYA